MYLRKGHVYYAYIKNMIFISDYSYWLYIKTNYIIFEKMHIQCGTKKMRIKKFDY